MNEINNKRIDIYIYIHACIQIINACMHLTHTYTDAVNDCLCPSSSEAINCAVNNGGCDQLCRHNDTSGKDFCACYAGYQRQLTNSEGTILCTGNFISIFSSSFRTDKNDSDDVDDDNHYDDDATTP